ncbi:M23 family metallopeptidase [Aureimonas sp. D3]|uniref:M23 family metallopeptidase n=1 Tax=Aureimonas sp. D3 TaxID=1638164 RepID=UPI000783A297|nr:M23 family metallopeptidase [Aureimonas sp. D3]
MAPSSQGNVFGSGAAARTIIISRGSLGQRWTVRTWVAASIAGLGIGALIGCLVFGGLFFFNDNIVRALLARETRMTNAYEERMATLRTEIDRLKTGQTKVRETVSAQVKALLTQQVELTGRFEQLQPLLEKARDMGILTKASPNAASDDASAAGREPSALPTAPNSSSPTIPTRHPEDISALSLRHEDVSEIAGLVLPTIRKSVDMVSDEQTSTIAELARTTRSRADHLAEVLGSVGIRVEETKPAIGGPYIPADGELSFSNSLNLLDQALQTYGRLKTKSARVPLADPLPGARVTSTFGVRSDPFFRRAALHSGVDLAAPTGTLVRATASGKVVSAGEAGGYGMMVEIDHGNGFSTRYAHLSEIDVASGSAIKAGQIVGRVGSTGRSTGSHLHYEVRTDETPVDPERYIRVGRKLAKL